MKVDFICLKIIGNIAVALYGILQSTSIDVLVKTLMLARFGKL